jgi:hypothetical protein
MTIAAGTSTESAYESVSRVKNEGTRRITITFPIVTADTGATIEVPFKGTIRAISYITPNTANDNLTSTLTITNDLGGTVFTSGAGIAENVAPFWPVDIAQSGALTVALLFNEAAGASSTFTVALEVI